MKKIFVVMLGLFLMAGCGFEIVDTGNRGIKTHFGKVGGESLSEGLYFYNPFTEDIQEMSVRTETLQHEATTYTKDIQQAHLKVAVMSNMDKTKVHIMYRDYGFDWQIKIIIPAVEGALKAVVGKWDAADLISNRDKARTEIEDILKISLGEKFVELIKFELISIDYADEFEKAVENKVVAIQRAIEAQNKTKQIEEEARQRIISAKAEAESMRIRADALTQNKNLVEYEAVQKWDGKLPQYMLGNTIPFIEVGKK